MEQQNDISEERDGFDTEYDDLVASATSVDERQYAFAAKVNNVSLVELDPDSKGESWGRTGWMLEVEREAELLAVP